MNKSMPRTTTFLILKSILALWLLNCCLSCSYGDYYLPDDSIRDEPIPDEFLQDLGVGWSWLRVSPLSKGGNQLSYQDYRAPNRLVTISRPGPTGPLMAADERRLWFIPRGKSLLGGAGCGQIDLAERTGTLLTEDNIELPSDKVLSVRQRPSGTVWIATKKGAIDFDPEAGFGKIFDDWWTFDQRGGGLQRNWGLFTTTPVVQDILERKDRVMFITGDLYLFNTLKTKWTHYRASSLIRHRNAYNQSLKETRVFYDRKAEKKYKYQVLIDIEVQEKTITPSGMGSLDHTNFTGAATADQAFLLSENGVTEIDFQAQQVRHHVRGHASTQLSQRCLQRHKKWNVCLYEKWEYDRLIWTQTANLPDVMATSVVIDQDRTAWFGFRGMTQGQNHEHGRAGLASYRNGVWRTVKAAPVNDVPVNALALGDDGLYVGTEKGLYLKNGDNWKQVRLGAKKDSFPSVWDLQITEQGVLWVATKAGIFSKILNRPGLPAVKSTKTNQSGGDK